jgi:hypothetical protein
MKGTCLGLVRWLSMVRVNRYQRVSLGLLATLLTTLLFPSTNSQMALQAFLVSFFALLLSLAPTPLAQQQQYQQPQQGHSSGGHHPVTRNLRAFDFALKSIRVSHGPFCSEGQRPKCDDCASYYSAPRRPRRNPYKSHPRAPLSVDLLMEQGSVSQAAKLLVSRYECAATWIFDTNLTPLPSQSPTDATGVGGRPLPTSTVRAPFRPLDVDSAN